MLIAFDFEHHLLLHETSPNLGVKVLFVSVCPTNIEETKKT